MEEDARHYVAQQFANTGNLFVHLSTSGIALGEESWRSEERCRLQQVTQPRLLIRSSSDKNPWIILQNFIGNADTWPIFLRAAFWSGENFDHRQRILVANFAYLNDVPLPVLMDALAFTIGRYFNQRARWYQVTARYNYLRSHYNHRQRAYSYHVGRGETQNLNHMSVDARGNIVTYYAKVEP